ncbi:MAG: hypothetical protein BWY20_01739 [Spirochaetes bacterium ADurb.Bin215]|nr:MAG: hypothetical protein BWY20_01739 [Spirochaetes bacterium ADurb.Bin215]
MKFFTINMVAAPVTMPLRAPHQVVRFQQRDRIMSGPKAAPKPPHAYPTMERMFPLSVAAMRTASRANPTTPARLMIIFFFESRSLMPGTSSVSEDVSTSSWESAVDMTAARTAARTKPANAGWKSAVVSARNTRSGFPPSPPTPGSPCTASYPIPTRPIEIAMTRQMIIQTIPMRRALGTESVSFIPINRARICGCPK